MARAAEHVVVVLDVGKTMGDESLMEAGKAEATRLQTAVYALGLITQQRIMFGRKNDTMAVVLVGSAETENPLNEQLGGYEHVQVLHELNAPTLETLRSVSRVESGDEVGDILDGVLVAYALLTGKSSGTKRVLVITDGASPISHAEQLDQIVGQFKSNAVNVEVIGVEFADDEERAESGVAGSTWSRTPEQIKNEGLLAALVDGVGGAIQPVKRAIDLITSVRSRSVMQATKFRGDLEISDAIKIGVYAYSKTAEQKLPSLKKMSVPAEEDGDDECKVQMNRVYRSEDDPDGELEKEDMSKGFRYGKSLVPFGEADIAASKYLSTKCLQVLGFRDEASVPRYHYMSTVDCIVAQPDNPGAQKALSALIRAMAQEPRKVAIVRYIKRANSVPILGVLSPYVPPSIAGAGDDGAGAGSASSTDFECFYLNSTPYAEDMREFTFHDFLADDAVKPSAAQSEAAAALIKDMELSKVENGRKVELLEPSTVFNPVNQRFYKALQTRALNPGSELPAHDEVTEACLHVDQDIVKRSTATVQEFKARFPLKAVDKKKASKRSRHWGDGDGDAPAAKKMPKDDSGSGGAGSGAAAAAEDVKELLQEQAAEVGAVDPVADFNALIARRGGDFVDSAVAGMKVQIDNLVDAGEFFHEKAIDCLVALRAGCVTNYSWKEFNQYLRKLKDEHGLPSSIQSEFWDEIKSSGITLVSSTEAADSDVSPEDAAAFLAAAAAPAAPAPAAVVAAPVDDDDDLDLLE